jgi:hypothetical protein
MILRLSIAELKDAKRLISQKIMSSACCHQTRKPMFFGAFHVVLHLCLLSIAEILTYV